MNPVILEERKLNVAAMDVFSRLQMDNIIFLGSEINDDVANTIIAQLLYISSQRPDEEIKMYINSPGGSVSAGLAIYDTMQYIPNNISTICTGMAASMGAVLFSGGTKGKRLILPHSRVLIHQPLGGAKGQASDIMIAAKEIEKSKKELVEILSENCGKDYDKIWLDVDRDYWMNSNEAVEYGIADEIIVNNKDK